MYIQCTFKIYTICIGLKITKTFKKVKKLLFLIFESQKKFFFKKLDTVLVFFFVLLK